ncbi:ABC transporter substrate-binding protein [Leisingera sp. M523]|uniref:substrate-binding periplasmic protein n=1 Tax=Leisingera sp. M523 TaxID=2867013 RepID=UPI0021A2B0E4|nr:transporter substrate-binding domain-containing protein [Leisingera sp. M523]UWQ29272.1 transporter substrate-binding domain-containing protein [Leisingera sp. M523]
MRRLRIAATIVAIGIAFPVLAFAETIFVAVEDKDYTPYYVWIDGQPKGPCVEIAAGAIRHMGAEVEFVRMPWTRVLKFVKTQRVDAGLCGTKTDEREDFSHYPDEPLLNYDATLFVRMDSGLTISDPEALTGKTFALVKGYSYGGIDDGLEMAGMTRVEATGRESMIKLLTLGRVETVLDTTLPFLADARRLGIEDQVRPLLPSLAETPGYLFFSRKPGHDALSNRFSEALTEFKTTPKYLAIKQRYGL